MHIGTTNEPKKKYYIVVVFLIFCISLTACGPRVYKNRFNIGSSYKKWVKEIGLFSNKNINVWGYEEDENLIRLYIMCDNGLDGYKELCDIINAHNKFVEENPDYFPKDMRFNIFNVAGSQQTISAFCNFPGGDPELGIEGSAKIQCMTMKMDVNSMVELSAGDDIQFDVPVVCLVRDIMPFNGEYSFLNAFSNAKKVIISFTDVENYSRETACKDIKSYLPNAEIYEEEFSTDDNEYHSHKIQ